MNFLKSLFSGPPSDRGLYLYVKPKACQEILRIRIDTSNDLSLADSGDGYFVRKMARGNRCPFPVEMQIYFDKNRRMTDKQIENGEFVSQEEYDAFMAEKEAN